MGMTIDGSIKELSKWRKNFNYDNGDYFYGGDDTMHSLDVAIETMRKYQKIQKIVEHWACFGNPTDSMIAISEVLEDGECK